MIAGQGTAVGAEWICSGNTMEGKVAGNDGSGMPNEHAFSLNVASRSDFQKLLFKKFL